jgi:hypothetical protein
LTMRRDKSFADDLIVHRGVVSGRVALLLRSAETKPLMPRFVPFRNLTCQSNRRPPSVRPSGEDPHRCGFGGGPSCGCRRLGTPGGFNPHPIVAATDGSVAVRVCNRLACGLQGLGPPVPINCPFPSSGARRQWSPPTLRAERLREKGDGEGGRQWLHPDRSVRHPEDPYH